MDVLPQDKYKELLGYLPRIKATIKEWLFISVRLAGHSDKDLTINDIAILIRPLFEDKEGKLYIGNNHEILLLVRSGLNHNSVVIAKNIKDKLPAGSCDVKAYQSTLDDLEKLELSITYRKPVLGQSLVQIRTARKENVIMVADDDMYQRAIVKTGLSKIGTIVEVSSGDEVEQRYCQYNPDILFLDIHMPGKSGLDIVYRISELDSDAYIVMISADGSQTNVADTWQKGAREFLTKPFTKERLIKCAMECPTLKPISA